MWRKSGHSTSKIARNIRHDLNFSISETYGSHSGYFNILCFNGACLLRVLTLGHYPWDLVQVSQQGRFWPARGSLTAEHSTAIQYQWIPSIG